MNTDPPPIIDPGERDELDGVFHHPVNDTEVPEPPTPPIPEEPAVPGPERPSPPGPVQPEVPSPPPPEPPKVPEVPKPGPPVHPEPPRPDPPRPDPPRPDPPRPDPPRPDPPRPPKQPEGPQKPELPKPPVRPDHPGPPRRPEGPQGPVRGPPGPPRDPEGPRQPEPPRGPEVPNDPEGPRQPEPPRGPEVPHDPEPPRGPELPVDCLPAGCALSETFFLAGFAGAIAALTACLAVAGLVVVIRYIGQYVLYTALILLILASVYLHIRRPEDARRLRRFLAERGREAMGRLWGWAIRRPEVRTFWFWTRSAIKIFLNVGIMYKLYCFSYLKTYSILLR
jgi:hypothetical protein